MLYIGYNNLPSDGGGAQLQRTIMLYCMCRALNNAAVRYVYYPITGISSPGLKRILDPSILSEGPSIESAFNSLIALDAHCMKASDLPQQGVTEIIINGKLTQEMLKAFLALQQQQDILVRCCIPYAITEAIPGIMRFGKNIYNASSSSGDASTKTFRVAIHVRRGDTMVIEQFRMLPNSYYVRLINMINNTLGNTPHVIALHTEIPPKPTEVTESQIANLGAPATISREQLRLEDFDLPNVEICADVSPEIAIRDFAESDIFIMSQSSMSIVGAIFNKNGIVVYHPFWHKPDPSWMVSTDPDFETRFTKSIHALANK